MTIMAMMSEDDHGDDDDEDDNDDDVMTLFNFLSTLQAKPMVMPSEVASG